MTFTKLYNDIIYEINTPNGIVTTKIYDINFTCIVAEHTNFLIKHSENISIIKDLDSVPLLINNKSTLMSGEHFNILPPIEKLSFDDIIEEPKHINLSIDFSKLKIGGLREQLKEISNVIRPRGIDREYLERIGMDEYEKGIILYGPPGTGKTTIARELSNVLGVKQFVVVNGPELLTKYVGQSEENVRNVLSNYSSDLKVVFFDEFDCLAKERTNSDGAGSQVANNIVNQILAIMDGVEKKNNILIIAATNRIDIIDPALLRPGRFGLSLHIELPDKSARADIFRIHLSKNIDNLTISKDISMDWLASNSDFFSGADIKGICKKARELALAEAAPDLCHLDNINIKLLNLETKHFESAFKIIKSGLVGNITNVSKLLPEGDGNPKIIESIIGFCDNAILSSRIHTYLLSGNGWSKKSSSCRVVCEKYRKSFDMIFIITENLIRELNKIDLSTGRSILIILDCLENLCGILNINSYNSKAIEYFNQFIGKVVTGKVILISTMRTKASDIFAIINPSFEWNIHNKCSPELE
jgi:ATP-dependent 26S proteasome regulatory subunit